MSDLRERWTGASLPGDYLLQKWLSGDDTAAFFETFVVPQGRRAVVKLVPMSAAQLAIWQRTRSLRHPNLLQLLDCGRAMVSGETAVFAVFEYADDTLAAALAQAPLSEAEALEVLDAVLPALAYLQDRGLALPSLDPDQVLGVGDAIKLATDRLCEASAGTPRVADLRAFWNQISPFPPARGAEILAQALAASAPGGPTPPRAAPPADAVVPPIAPAPPVPAPVPASKPFPKWPLLAAAAVGLGILGLNLRRPPETAAQPAPLPAPAAISEPATPPKSGQSADHSVSLPQAETGMWRVIAFTARTRESAAAVVEQINQSPGFDAAVYTPAEKKGFFLVALGAPMKRSDALRLQTKVREARLTRSVYVKKFLD